jgi:hypothetical protein
VQVLSLLGAIHVKHVTPVALLALLRVPRS